MPAHGTSIRIAPGKSARIVSRVAWALLALVLGAWVVCRSIRPEPATPAAAPTPGPSASSAAPALALIARLEFPTGRGGDAKPSGLLAGDLDGDGRDELIAATRGPGALEIWSGLSAALLPAPEPRAFPLGDFALGPVWFGPLEPASKSPRALVALASRATLELTVVDVRGALRAQGSSALPASWRRSLPLRPRVLASGDLGRDGQPEIAVVTIEDDLLLIAGPDDMKRLRLCDELATCALFLSDGKGIAFGFQGTRRIVIYRPCKTSVENAVGLEPAESYQLEGLPRDLDEVDLDGDGDTELAVAAGDHGVLAFGLGRPGGSAAWLDAKPAEARTGAVPIDLEHGDFERDGKSELVAIGLHSQDWTLIGCKDGALVVRSSAYAGQRPSAGCLGDFDGDGALDLAIANPDAKRISVIFAERSESGAAGFPFRSAARTASDRMPHSLASGDLDGDGSPEIVGLAAAEGTLSVFRNDHGALAAGARQCLARSADAVACADLDGDGQLDAAYLQRPLKECSLVIAFGDGKGNLWERAATPPTRVGASAGDLLLADVDGDGKVDAIVADPESDRVWLLRNRTEAGRDLTFSPAAALEIGSGPRALARIEIADANGAAGGAAEIAVALEGPGDRRAVAFLRARKDASGEIALEERLRLPTSRHPFSLAAADLDGDGRKDLAVLATDSGGDSDGWVIPCLQAADGSFKPIAPMRTGARPYRIAAGDLDGDGKAEILVTAQNSHNVDLWLARPGEPLSFARAPDLGVGTGPLDLELVDLDRDGRPEIVVANSFSDDLSVVRLR